MIRIRRDQNEISTPKTEVVKKLNRQLVFVFTLKTYNKPSKQLFPNRQPLRYPNLTEVMKTYRRFKQYKHSTPNFKHKTNITTTEVSPWNDQ